MTKDNLTTELFVLQFVQEASKPQTHSKRLRACRKFWKNCPKNLTIKQWMFVWRGFYYIIWYEEMRKGGQELIEELGSIENDAFFFAGFKSLSESWESIDDLRIDKYMYLARIMLRTIIKKQISSILNSEILFQDNKFIKSLKIKADSPSINAKTIGIHYIINVTNNSIGLLLHLVDVYLEEIKSALDDQSIDDDQKAEVYIEMVKPFIYEFKTIKDDRLREMILDESFSVRKSILTSIIEIFENLDQTMELNGKDVQYRNQILEIYKNKMENFSTNGKAKRKIIGYNPRTKKFKYEKVTAIPFVKSIIPLPVV
ncbi:ribosomal RNA processing protein 1 A-like protein [Sarcoptes scabiei]|uniref:Ribosomal RNA processing protein 1 A-like protein n=1 Tax=Sarcoptes scabiei TaxID=52283 RepID=A0A131ZWX3_SARSC|nr:ribosomal RNA processing protein 1 A-like protein [Sarcoptes scabiei]